ncbi:MAG: MBL fold metallo-hydrolase [SAR324 cluster bacterium]|uniref:MBL fold metallo-hydrolase n=1 Tax=SAR324 cluster bacterium TaxID=2024889 RepID=A0A7X9FRT8_9DELT|nr:MBL fold metallo-hydrolase [SAR324 cluster bacterium]
MKRIGTYQISSLILSRFYLDGGAMFGAIPKNLWEKWFIPDEANRIELVARSLLLCNGERKILIDLGLGEKWSQKQREIFAIFNTPREDTQINPLEITDIILTHLHFDHSGGVSNLNDHGMLELCYPKATIHVQRSNFEAARNPNPREKASYLKENVEILLKGELNLIEGSCEILPNIWVHESNGHTRGLQYIEVKDSDQNLLFLSDLVPTSHHLPKHYTMGYDMWAERVMEEKESLLSYAEQNKSLVVFEHDPVIEAARIGRNAKGNFAVIDSISI